jgi:hypothetical protein
MGASYGGLVSARRALVFIMVAPFALSLVAVAPATAGQAGLATDAPDVYVVRVSGQREQRSFTETWTANVTFDLEQEERSPNGKFVAAYYRARSGSVNWEISGDDEGACSWRQRFSFRVGAGINNGQLRFGGGRYAASIAAQVDSVTARKLRDRGGEYGCVSVPLRVSPDGEWLSDGLGKGHAGDPLRGSSSSEGKVEWNLDPRYREGGLRAVAGGPHSVQRGRKVQLDGSLSTPKRKIKSYRWTYTLGPSCPKGTRPAEKSGSTKATTSFVVLCRVHALLTVRDGKGHEATDTAVVTVQPRPASIWRTTTDFGVRRDVSLPGFTVPTVYPDGPSVVTHALLRCPDGIGVEVFCTYGKARYQLAPPVDDPGGPFNGWSYVGAPQMKIDKVAFMNPFLEPNAPPPDPRTLNWYWYNASQGRRRQLHAGEHARARRLRIPQHPTQWSLPRDGRLHSRRRRPQ